MRGNAMITSAKNYNYRHSTYRSELHETERTFSADAAEHIHIHAFARNFAPGVEHAPDVGFVLLTNGMSDRRMTLPTSLLEKGEKPRAELMWYVREPTRDIIFNLRWLAMLPFVDTTWFGFGHRVPMPDPPLAGCAFKTFLLLTPIIGPDKRIAEKLSIDHDTVEILTVHLISDAEYAFVKQNGVDPFLDLLDERAYPLIFDPKRESYV